MSQAEMINQWAKELNEGFIEVSIAHFEALARIEELETALEKFEDEIEEVIAEFGDQPELRLSCISERIMLARHYRANPNATEGRVMPNRRRRRSTI